MSSSQVVLGQVDVAFDDERSVAGAGLLLPATLAERLGSSRAPTNWSISATGRGRPRPGRTLLTLVHAMVAGGDCIDDVELLRDGVHPGSTRTSGDGGLHRGDVATRVHLRACPPAGPSLRRDPGQVWAAGAGPGSDHLTGRKPVCQLAMIPGFTDIVELPQTFTLVVVEVRGTRPVLIVFVGFA
jgi:hypothetical protein